MQVFTANQAREVLSMRAAWNQNERALARRFGISPIAWAVTGMSDPVAPAANSALMGNATTLPRDVWGTWDTESVVLQRDILGVYNDLAASVSQPMDIGKLVHYFRTVTDSGSVNISLDGRSMAKLDQPAFDYKGTPLPIIDSTWGFGWRQVRAAQSEGISIDTDARDNANRKVAEKLEDIVLNGDAKIVVGSSALYGLRNHPKRATRSTGVTLAGATGAQWMAEIIATVALLNARYFYEPATIYVNYNDWLWAERTEFTANYPMTIAQRVLAIPGVGKIVPASKIPADDIIAVIKRKSVLQLLNGMPMTTTPLFRANIHDDYNFVTMAAAALEIKYDANDLAGVAHSS